MKYGKNMDEQEIITTSTGCVIDVNSKKISAAIKSADILEESQKSIKEYWEQELQERKFSYSLEMLKKHNLTAAIEAASIAWARNDSIVITEIRIKEKTVEEWGIFIEADVFYVISDTKQQNHFLCTTLRFQCHAWNEDEFFDLCDLLGNCFCSAFNVNLVFDKSSLKYVEVFVSSQSEPSEVEKLVFLDQHEIYLPKISLLSFYD